MSRTCSEKWNQSSQSLQPAPWILLGVDCWRCRALSVSRGWESSSTYGHTLSAGQIQPLPLLQDWGSLCAQREGDCRETHGWGHQGCIPGSERGSQQQQFLQKGGLSHGNALLPGLPTLAFWRRCRKKWYSRHSAGPGASAAVIQPPLG